MATWFHSFFNLLIPRQCVVCNRPLSHAEKCLCTCCNIQVPRTYYHLHKDNIMEKLFWGQIPIERATAFFHYRKGGEFRSIIHKLKYKGRKDIGEVLGSYIAQEILDGGFFNDVDVIIPVPLHPKRFKSRGYNQSECIAKGIADITGIPVNNQAILRTVYTESQTGFSIIERLENVKDAFKTDQPGDYTGKHILLVDDVLTTGATIMACALTLSHVKDIRFSVITLGITDQS